MGRTRSRAVSMKLQVRRKFVIKFITILVILVPIANFVPFDSIASNVNDSCYNANYSKRHYSILRDDWGAFYQLKKQATEKHPSYDSEQISNSITFCDTEVPNKNTHPPKLYLL
jgi:hypothetical protein